MDGKQLASPYLEGGGGYNFEHRVQAYFLLLMLAGGRDPVLTDILLSSIFKPDITDIT